MDKLDLNDVEHLLGLPWELEAYGPDSFDCWGLVTYLLNLLGVDCSFKVNYRFPKGIKHEFKMSVSNWVEIEAPINNCVVYGYRGDIPCHIGFVIDNFVLHSVGEGSGSVVLNSIPNFKNCYSEVKFFKWLQ